MILSHQHRFIFVKTRKTAGTSMEIALSGICGTADVITPISEDDESIRDSLGFPGPQNYCVGSSVFFNHMRASSIRKHLDGEVWDSYFKFTIERNPFDKALSRYWWSTRHIDPRPDVSEYIETVPDTFLSCWDIYASGGDLDVDYVIRYEAIDQGLAEVSDQIGVEVRLPSMRAKGAHRLDRRPYQEVLDLRSRRRIERVCSREIAALGYVWTDSSSEPIQIDPRG